MTIKLYNTMSHQLEEFIPGGERKELISDYPAVSIYSCGPTVYSYAHIGNFRTFIFNDLLSRYLSFRGFTVAHAMNITDVDDKTIKGSNEENISLKEYTQKYTKIFLEDFKKLNIKEPKYLPRATDSIDDMIEIINRLKQKDLIYEKDGSTYFSIAKYGKYGQLFNIDPEQIKTGLRYDTDEYEKDDIRDFVLWKAPKKNEPSWDTPFGKGRPGWHIECSAMIRKIFGKTIDIHTGGVDLVFPHHENEIAQSEGAYDEKFVRYWIHAEHLLVEGSKMSKSKGNFYTLKDLLAKGCSARAIRYLLLSAHYRKQLNFTMSGLNQAESALEKIDNLKIRLAEITKEESKCQISEINDKFMTEFCKTMDDDLNVSGGMGKFFEYLKEINILIAEEKISKNDVLSIMTTFERIDEVFGFIFFEEENKTLSLSEEKINDLIAERINAKKEKNFARADEIRQYLEENSIILEDTKEGTRWKIKK